MTDVDVDRQLEIGVSLEPNATSGIQHVYKYTNIYIYIYHTCFIIGLSNLFG